MTSSVRQRFAPVNGVELAVTEAGDPGAPPILLLHGFPESARSWRHQLPALGAAGYHAIAPDLRGYGRSSRPAAVSDYRTEVVSADLLGLLDETGHEQAVFVGHDWGALVLWDLARLHPERVRAVIAASVPFPFWPARPTEFLRAVMGDSFFYMLYFQDVGPGERELEADVRRTLSIVLWNGSAQGFTMRGGSRPPEPRPAAGTGFLTDQLAPPPLPWTWLTEEDFERFVDDFGTSGFFGPLSYYRNLDANYDRLLDRPPSVLTMPCWHVTGDRDVVLLMTGNADRRMAEDIPGFRGQLVLPDVGHWTQQESPAEFTAALRGCLADLP